MSTIGQERTASSVSSAVEEMLKNERATFARRLYDLELQAGLAFGAAYNGDSNSAADQLEQIVEKLGELRRRYES